MVVDKGEIMLVNLMKRGTKTTIGALLTASLVLIGAMSAEASPPSTAGVESVASATSAADQLIIDTVTQNVRAVEAEGLSAGGSAVVCSSGAVTLTLTADEAGTYVLVSSMSSGRPTLGTSRGVTPQFGFCHAAAMAAVYTIGAALLAAAAISGGLTIAGVFLAPAALNALSVAMAAGAGVSALVAVYIC